MTVERKMDIPYTSGRALDVYWPSAGSVWPVVVFLHGGDIDKRLMGALATAVAGQGAVVFVPAYQSDEPPPDKIVTGAEQVACAVRFARAYGTEYGGDPARIVIVGHSAGGAFGALISLAGDEYHGACSVTEGSAVPDLFIGLDGAYDILRYITEETLGAAPDEEWVKISPYAHIPGVASASDPPFHLFVGREIELLRDGQAFRDALQRAGYRASLTQFPGVSHLAMASASNTHTVAAIVTLVRQ
jgi:acetyl esterase/lipase